MKIQMRSTIKWITVCVYKNIFLKPHMFMYVQNNFYTFHILTIKIYANIFAFQKASFRTKDLFQYGNILYWKYLENRVNLVAFLWLKKNLIEKYLWCIAIKTICRLSVRVYQIFIIDIHNLCLAMMILTT